MDGKTDRELNTEIFELRNRLSTLKNYYEQLIDIGETLQENENDLFEEEDLRYFKIFTDKSERLSNNAQLLCDNLIHLREALDATLNYNLNNTMKLFTMVTIIFQPLTPDRGLVRHEFYEYAGAWLEIRLPLRDSSVPCGGGRDSILF